MPAQRIVQIRQKIEDAQGEAERELKTPGGEATGLSVRVRTGDADGIDLIVADGEPFHLDEDQWQALGLALAWLGESV